MYDVQLDRLDVAVKAVLTLFRLRRWDQLEHLGIERWLEEDLEAALLASDLPMGQWRDAEVFAAICKCSQLVDAAVLLQALYQAKEGTR